MPLNNYFNIKRFSLLLQQDLLINRTKYLLGILGLGLISYLLFYWYLSTNKSQIMSYVKSINSRYMTCFMFYIMGVGVIAGTAFPDLTDKIKTANYLLSPASTFEKFLVQFLLRIGLFVPIALGLFWTVLRLAKASLVSDITKGFDVSKIPYFNFRMLITSYNGQLIDDWQIVFFAFGLFSYGVYLFAGTTFFRRYALIKTVIFSAAVLCFSVLFMMLLSHVSYPKNPYLFGIQLYTFRVTQDLDSTKFSLLCLTLLSWIFFLGIAYFKLKEKEA